MVASIFDSMIDLNDEHGLVVLYTKLNEDIKEQHAVLLFEIFEEDQRKLYSYDFYPIAPYDNNQFNNVARDIHNKIRPGYVRERITDITTLTSIEVLEKLHIIENFFFRNYIQSRYTLDDISFLISKAKEDKDKPPYFVYSGKKPNDIDAYNCITWVKHIFAEASVKLIDKNLLTKLIDNTTGLCIESCFGKSIPKFEGAEVSPSCSIS
jgi:hypothetical protein